MSAEADMTEDAFLGGRLTIRQPREGYRAAMDPVLLAGSVIARAGQRVLDLGCGAGAAGLCLAARVPGVVLTGIELQPVYAELARVNAAANGAAMTVVEGDLAELRLVDVFDHVLMNPPYFPPGSGTAARDAGREAAQREATPIDQWLRFAARRLVPGGWLWAIQIAERLPGLMAGLPPTMGTVTVLPIAPRAGRDAGRVILRARKGGRAAFRLAAPFVLHGGTRHEADGEDLTAAARAVLRDGGALTF